MRIYNCILIVLCVSAYKKQKISKVTEAASFKQSTNSSACLAASLQSAGLKQGRCTTQAKSWLTPKASLRHRGKAGGANAAAAAATEINAL